MKLELFFTLIALMAINTVSASTTNEITMRSNGVTVGTSEESDFEQVNVSCPEGSHVIEHLRRFLRVNTHQHDPFQSTTSLYFSRGIDRVVYEHLGNGSVSIKIIFQSKTTTSEFLIMSGNKCSVSYFTNQYRISSTYRVRGYF